MRYVWAVTLVALGLLIGFILQPAFGRSQAYATFYPVVLIAAYVLGPRPAALGAGLSAVVAYWCFIPPAFQWKWDNQVGAALAFFLGTSAVAIFLINRLLRTAVDKAERQSAKTDLARVNAVIFADLGARNGRGWTPMTAFPAAQTAAARPSERSFDRPSLDRTAGEPDPAGPERSSDRSADAASADGRSATLH